jgi:hypothetical protein
MGSRKAQPLGGPAGSEGETLDSRRVAKNFRTKLRPGDEYPDPLLRGEIHTAKATDRSVPKRKKR